LFFSPGKVGGKIGPLLAILVYLTAHSEYHEFKAEVDLDAVKNQLYCI